MQPRFRNFVLVHVDSSDVEFCSSVTYVTSLSCFCLSY